MPKRASTKRKSNSATKTVKKVRAQKSVTLTSSRSLKSAKRAKLRNSPINEIQIVNAAQQGFIHAASRTMTVMGKNWIVRNGWVGILHANGRFTRKQQLHNTARLQFD